MQYSVLQSQKRLRNPRDLIMECTIPMFTVTPTINSVQQGTLTCVDINITAIKKVFYNIAPDTRVTPAHHTT